MEQIELLNKNVGSKNQTYQKSDVAGDVMRIQACIYVYKIQTQYISQLSTSTQHNVLYV